MATWPDRSRVPLGKGAREIPHHPTAQEVSEALDWAEESGKRLQRLIAENPDAQGWIKAELHLITLHDEILRLREQIGCTCIKLRELGPKAADLIEGDTPCPVHRRGE